MGTFLKQLGRLLVSALIEHIVEAREIGGMTAKKIGQHVIGLYKQVRTIDPVLERVSEAVDSNEQTMTLTLTRAEMDAFVAVHSEAESIAARVGKYLDKVRS